MGRVSDLLLAPLGLLGGVPRLYVVVLLRGHRRRVVVLAEGVEVLLVRVQVRVQVRVRVRVRVRVQVRFGFGFGFGFGLEESKCAPSGPAGRSARTRRPARGEEYEVRSELLLEPCEIKLW